MIERDHSFDIREQKNYDIQKKLENILQKDFMLSTNTTKLGRSLIRITYFDENVEKDLQKDNRITILYEPNKRIYVQIRGSLTDAQVGQIWDELKKDLEVIKEQEAKKEKMSNKDEIIKKIINSIKTKGYIIENIEAQNFIENFQEKYHRLPKDEEIDSIVTGYIIMKNEEYLFQNIKESDIEAIPKKVEAILEEKNEDYPLQSIKESDKEVIPKKVEVISDVKKEEYPLQDIKESDIEVIPKKVEVISEEKKDEYPLQSIKESDKEAIPKKVEAISKEKFKEISLPTYQNGLLIISPPNGRRKCPSCDNEGLIHELEDKNVILLAYPKIYGKKYRCGVCGQEWREQ